MVRLTERGFMDYKRQLKRYLEKEVETIRSLSLEDIDTVMGVLEEAQLGRRRVFVCGNGGSAATASHYAGDFNKGVNEKLGVRYSFECLNDNVPTMLAVANDIGYEEVFRFPLKCKMEAGDVLIGISGSGNSMNIVNAMEYAKSIGGTTIAIVGYDGGKLKKMADYCIHVAVDDMQISEDVHMILAHLMMSVFCGNR